MTHQYCLFTDLPGGEARLHNPFSKFCALNSPSEFRHFHVRTYPLLPFIALAFVLESQGYC
jgi:hypothetical protein